jgi:hypothetical protein
MKNEYAKFNNDKSESSFKNSTPIKYRILADLFRKLPEPSKADKERFYNKRGYPMPAGFKPFSYSIYNELKRRYGKDSLVKLFGYPKRLFEGRYLIPVCNPDGTIETLRAYSYNADPKYKKLAPGRNSGLKTVMPYGMEKAGDDIVLNEGEEKAELINYLLPDEFTGISMPGIGMYNYIFDYPEYFKGKNVTVLFDRKRSDISQEKGHPEIKNALRTVKRLQIAGVKSVNVALLPEPTDKEENDIDSYFKDLNLSHEEKQNHLRDILHNALTVQEFKRKFKSILAKKGNNKKGKKFRKAEFIKQVETKELEEIRTERPKILLDFINAWHTDKSIQVLYDTSSTGTYKTEACINLALSLRERKKSLVYMVPTKKLADNVQKRMEEKGLKVVRINSIFDICQEYNESIFSSLPADYIFFKDNKPQFTQPAKINKCFNANRNTAPVCKNCKISNFKADNGQRYICPKQKHFDSWIEPADIYLFTHDKAIFSLDKIINDYNPYVVVIDEDIISKMSKVHEITTKMLNESLAINTGNESIEGVFNALINLLKQNRKGILEYHDLRKRLTKIDPDFFKHLKKIYLQEIMEQDLTFDDMEAELPTKFEVELIKALKKHWNKITIQKNKLIISQYRELKFKDVPVIVLDATGKKEFLELALKKNVQEYKAIVKRDNLQVFKCVDSTFSETALTANEGSLYKKLLNWIKGLINKNPDEKIFIGAGINIEKSLSIDLQEYQNIYYAHHYANRGLNNDDFADCNISVILPPTINDNTVINTVKAFTDNELSRDKKTAWINTDATEQIQENLFKDVLLKNWYMWTMASEPMQTAGRTLRGDTKALKQWYFFGSKIDLLEYGLQPEIFTLKKQEFKNNYLDDILQEFKFLPNPILSNQNRILPFEKIISNEANLTALKKYQPQSTVNSLLRKFRNIYVTILENFIKNPDLAIVQALLHLPENTPQSTVNSLLRKFEKKLTKAYKSYAEQNGLKKVFLPLKKDTKHFIYCLPDANINQILSFYPKEILIHDPVKMASDLNSENIPGKNINEEILKEDPLVRTLSFRNLIQNYEPVKAIFFSYVNESLKENTDFTGPYGPCFYGPQNESLNNKQLEETEVTEIDHINSLIYLLGSEVSKPDLNLNSISQSFVNYQVTPKTIETLEENFKMDMKEDPEAEFLNAYEKYVSENKTELDKLIQATIRKRVNENKPFDFDYLEKLEIWSDDLPDEPTPQKFKRAYVYSYFIENFDNLQKDINLTVSDTTAESAPVSFSTDKTESNDYIRSLMDIVPAKLKQEYNTYFSAIAKNSYEKNINLNQSLKDMNRYILNIQNQDTRPKNTYYSQPKTAIKGRENNTGTITLEQTKTSVESQPLTSELIAQRIKDYKFDNTEFLQGIDETEIFNYLYSINLDKNKLNDFDYTYTISLEIAVKYNISTIQASCFIQNYAFYSPKIINFTEKKVNFEKLPIRIQKILNDMSYSKNHINILSEKIKKQSEIKTEMFALYGKDYFKNMMNEYKKLIQIM